MLRLDFTGRCTGGPGRSFSLSKEPLSIYASFLGRGVTNLQKYPGGILAAKGLRPIHSKLWIFVKVRRKVLTKT